MITTSPAPTVKIPPLPELAKIAAVRRLMDALVGRGHHHHAARAIALAVCDPAAARRQLDEPGQLRVDGGYLEVIQTSVWTPALLPYPVNPRVLPAYAYPIEGRGDRRAPLPDLLPSSDSDATELVTPPMPPANLIGAMDAQVDYLRRTNDLADTVGRLGIREPLLLLPLVVSTNYDEVLAQAAKRRTRARQASAESHLDDLDAPAVLTTVDGSSRLTAAYSHLDLEPSEVFFKLTGDDRALRHRISTTLSLLSRPVDALDEEEVAALRVVTSPASVIVGFVPDTPGVDSLSAAIDSRLGALHVDPARPWSTASRLDVQLDVALRALEEAGRLDEDEAAWLAGRLDIDATDEAGLLTYPDVRAAYLLLQIRKADSITAKALRALTARQRISPKLRAEIAAEGALRAFRSSMTDAQANSARTLLAALYQMDELKDPWDVDPRNAMGTRKTVLSGALRELRTHGAPGPLIRRILVLSFYWMARYRIVSRQTRGGQEDRRDITAVVSLMASTEHGVRQLVQLIADGRSERTPRRVDAAGRVIKSAAGNDVRLDAAWIRETWRSEPIADSPTKDEGTSPEAELNARFIELAAQLKNTTVALERLNDPVTPDGTALVDTIGLPPPYVTRLLGQLMDIQERLLILRLLGMQNAAETDDDDETGGES